LGAFAFLFYLRFLYFVGVLNQTIIPIAFVGYKNNSLHLEQKYAWIFVRVHNLFREANGLPREKLEENSKLWGTDRCKRTNIRAYFLRQMYAIAIVFTFFFKCFSQHARFWKLPLGNITRIFLSFSWGIFSYVRRLDQSCANENICWIIRVYYIISFPTHVRGIIVKCKQYSEIDIS